jgi:hypothetical protein
VREFLACKQITVLEHPQYSPDVTSSDFLLFLKIQEIWKGRHFDGTDGSSEGRSTKSVSKIVLKGGMGTGIGA